MLLLVINQRRFSSFQKLSLYDKKIIGISKKTDTLSNYLYSNNIMYIMLVYCCKLN